jgi:hypothetical protein
MERALDRQNDPALMRPTFHCAGRDQSTYSPKPTVIIEIAHQVSGCRKARRKIFLGIDCHATGEALPAPDEIRWFGLIAAAGASASWILFRVGFSVGCMA